MIEIIPESINNFESECIKLEFSSLLALGANSRLGEIKISALEGNQLLEYNLYPCVFLGEKHEEPSSYKDVLKDVFNDLFNDVANDVCSFFLELM